MGQRPDWDGQTSSSGSVAFRTGAFHSGQPDWDSKRMTEDIKPILSSRIQGLTAYPRSIFRRSGNFTLMHDAIARYGPVAAAAVADGQSAP